MSITRPAEARAAKARAAAAPAAPYRKDSPNIVSPTVAATTGLTTVTVASGAVRPAPRYEAWESSSPVVASAAIASMSAHWASGCAVVKATATDLVNTDAMPKAVPAAAASSTLRATGRFMPRASAKSRTTAPAVAGTSRPCSAPESGSECERPVSASSPARPAVAIRAPRQAVRPARRPTKSAASGSAKTMVRAPSGWTSESGP